MSIVRDIFFGAKIKGNDNPAEPWEWRLYAAARYSLDEFLVLVELYEKEESSYWRYFLAQVLTDLYYKPIIPDLITLVQSSKDPLDKLGYILMLVKLEDARAYDFMLDLVKQNIPAVNSTVLQELSFIDFPEGEGDPRVIRLIDLNKKLIRDINATIPCMKLYEDCYDLQNF